MKNSEMVGEIINYIDNKFAEINGAFWVSEWLAREIISNFWYENFNKLDIVLKIKEGDNMRKYLFTIDWKTIIWCANSL
jgi:hypothetical protein